MSTFFGAAPSASHQPSGKEEELDLEAIALLIDRLKDEDVALRAESNASLGRIAEALGPERTRDELVPFLCESVDDADEVLAAMAKSLGDLGRFVAGGPKPLLEPLEALAAIEESAVRDEAAQAAAKIADSLTDEEAEAYYLPFATRLATHDWFTGRMTACGLIAPLLRRSRISDDARRRGAELFARLCADDTPMVRRVAATQLAHFAAVVNEGARSSGLLQNDDDGNDVGVLEEDDEGGLSPAASEEETDEDMSEVATVRGRRSFSDDHPPAHHQQSSARSDDVVSLFRSLADDEQDSVRLQTAPNCVALAKAWKRCPKKQRAVILPALIAASADRSWRVRWSAAVAVADTLKSFFHAASAAKRDAVAAFVDLLNDVEVEVRVASAARLGHVAEALGDASAAVALILPTVETLAADAAQQVRASLASSFGALARALGAEPTKNRLFPVVLTLLRDANSEVRLNVISNLADVHDVAGGDRVKDSLVPAVVDLAGDAKWRVRAAVIDHVPLVAARLVGKTKKSFLSVGKDYRRLSDDDEEEEDDDDDSKPPEELLDERLSAACVEWLRDDVAAVRDAAAVNLHNLARLLGPAWTEAVALPRVILVAKHTSYLRRVTSLKAARYLCDAISARALATSLLPVVLELTEDHVPNVRFNAAKALPELAARLRGADEHKLSPSVGDKRERQFLSTSDDESNVVTKDASFAHLVDSLVLPRLAALAADDPDADVRAFAADASRQINNGDTS